MIQRIGLVVVPVNRIVRYILEAELHYVYVFGKRKGVVFVWIIRYTHSIEVTIEMAWYMLIRMVRLTVSTTVGAVCSDIIICFVQAKAAVQESIPLALTHIQAQVAIILIVGSRT